MARNFPNWSPRDFANLEQRNEDCCRLTRADPISEAVDHIEPSSCAETPSYLRKLSASQKALGHFLSGIKCYID